MDLVHNTNFQLMVVISVSLGTEELCQVRIFFYSGSGYKEGRLWEIMLFVYFLFRSVSL